MVEAKKPRIYVGWDSREEAAYDLCCWSILRHASQPVEIIPVKLTGLIRQGVYDRPFTRKGAQLWDEVSEAPMATEFACSRFFIPLLAKHRGWGLFMDCDMLVQGDICEVFAAADPSKALMCVKHAHRPLEDVKMDAQAQTAYHRKNWSSFVLWNCAHPAHEALTLTELNRWPGRDLHAFKWLTDELIGSLPLTWNFLVGYDEAIGQVKNLHFTLGTPDMVGSGTPFADRWERESEFLTAWKRRK